MSTKKDIVAVFSYRLENVESLLWYLYVLILLSLPPMIWLCTLTQYSSLLMLHS